MAGGDFTPEAYEQLREAYAKEAQDAKSVEERGHDIMGLNLGLETAPVDSPWADLIPNAQYPSGKSQYLDEKQDPAAILELMRGSVSEPEEETEEEEEISDEALEEEIDNILQDEDEVEKDEEDTDEDEEEDDGDEEEEEEVEPVDAADADSDPETIASQIAELRAELEQMNFVPESEDDPEVSDDEPE